MLYSILIFLIFVAIVGSKNYLLNQEIPLMSKIIHLTLMFTIFQYYFNEFRLDLWNFLRNGSEAFYTSRDFVKYSKTFDIITSIVYLLNCGFVAVISLDLAMRAKGKTLFLYSVPFISIITSLDFYKLVLNNGLDQRGLGPYSIILFFVSIFFGIIILIYFKSPVKRIFA